MFMNKFVSILAALVCTLTGAALGLEPDALPDVQESPGISQSDSSPEVSARETLSADYAASSQQSRTETVSVSPAAAGMNRAQDVQETTSSGAYIPLAQSSVTIPADGSTYNARDYIDSHNTYNALAYEVSDSALYINAFGYFYTYTPGTYTITITAEYYGTYDTQTLTVYADYPETTTTYIDDFIRYGTTTSVVTTTTEQAPYITLSDSYVYIYPHDIHSYNVMGYISDYYGKLSFELTSGRDYFTLDSNGTFYQNGSYATEGEITIYATNASGETASAKLKIYGYIDTTVSSATTTTTTTTTTTAAATTTMATTTEQAPYITLSDSYVYMRTYGKYTSQNVMNYIKDYYGTLSFELTSGSSYYTLDSDGNFYQDGSYAYDGEITITATNASGETATAKLRIYGYIETTVHSAYIYMKQNSVNITADGTTYSVKDYISHWYGDKLTYESSDPDSLYIDSNGKFYTYHAGTYTITITASYDYYSYYEDVKTLTVYATGGDGTYITTTTSTGATTTTTTTTTAATTTTTMTTTTEQAPYIKLSSSYVYMDYYYYGSSSTKNVMNYISDYYGTLSFELTYGSSYYTLDSDGNFYQNSSYAYDGEITIYATNASGETASAKLRIYGYIETTTAPYAYVSLRQSSVNITADGTTYSAKNYISYWDGASLSYASSDDGLVIDESGNFYTYYPGTYTIRITANSSYSYSSYYDYTATLTVHATGTTTDMIATTTFYPETVFTTTTATSYWWGDEGVSTATTRETSSTTTTNTTTKLTLDVTQLDLTNGDQYSLTANQTGLTFISNNPGIAIVSPSGVITAVGEGTAVITAYNSSYDAVQVRVYVGAADSKPIPDFDDDGRVSAADAARILEFAAYQGVGGQLTFYIWLKAGSN